MRKLGTFQIFFSASSSPCVFFYLRASRPQTSSATSDWTELKLNTSRRRDCARRTRPRATTNVESIKTNWCLLWSRSDWSIRSVNNSLSRLNRVINSWFHRTDRECIVHTEAGESSTVVRWNAAITMVLSVGVSDSWGRIDSFHSSVDDSWGCSAPLFRLTLWLKTLGQIKSRRRRNSTSEQQWQWVHDRDPFYPRVNESNHCLVVTALPVDLIHKRRKETQLLGNIITILDSDFDFP